MLFRFHHSASPGIRLSGFLVCLPVAFDKSFLIIDQFVFAAAVPVTGPVPYEVGKGCYYDSAQYNVNDIYTAPASSVSK